MPRAGERADDRGAHEATVTGDEDPPAGVVALGVAHGPADPRGATT